MIKLFSYLFLFPVQFVEMLLFFLFCVSTKSPISRGFHWQHWPVLQAACVFSPFTTSITRYRLSLSPSTPCPCAERTYGKLEGDRRIGWVTHTKELMGIRKTAQRSSVPLTSEWRKWRCVLCLATPKPSWWRSNRAILTPLRVNGSVIWLGISFGTTTFLREQVFQQCEWKKRTGATMLVLYYFPNTFGSWMWGKTLHRKTLDTG